MNRQDDKLDRVLDDALARIRQDEPDAQLERAAADRVWARVEKIESESHTLETAQIQSCSDFQALIRPHLDGKLSPARSLLIKDHLGECVTCRRVLRQVRSDQPGRMPAAAARRRPGSWLSTMGWRLAAAAVIFLALIGFSFKTDVLSFESGGLIRIEAIDGELFQYTGEGTRPLSEGDVITLKRGEGIRTAKGSTALVTLADDSRLEMRERSDLAVKKRSYLLPGRRPDGVIGLERGSIIVEASDQGSGHLYVDADDCQVAVKGTVFAVNRGTKGSRISVIEGEVEVDHSGQKDVLLPGDQATTHPSVTRVSFEEEIAWSQNSREHLELLREMQVISREIEQVLRPGLRYSTELLDLVPADTAVYVGIPNVSDELGDAFEIVKERMDSNEILRDWWQKEVMEPGHLETVLDKVRAYGDHLGEEVVVSVGMNGRGDVEVPLFLARLQGRESFRQLLEDEIVKLQTMTDEEIGMHIIEGPLTASPTASCDDDVIFWIQDDLVAVTPSFDRLLQLDTVLRGVPGAAIEGGDFHERLADQYGEGVEWLVGVDLELMLRAGQTDMDSLERFGLADVQHLIVERRQQDDMTQHRAVLTFDQPRRRIAAWLAEPAAMGALEYISPDASMAGAFVTKDLDLLVEELFGFISKTDESFEENLAEFQREHGVDIREDFAAPLGGEFALALDGPLAPMPSWKLIIEVYDPARLQQTMEWLVEQVNRLAADAGRQGFGLERETSGGREFFRLESLDTGLAVNYVFDGGYLVAGPSRGLLDRALRNREAGISLLDARDFVRLLPQDGQVNFSGMIYHNLGPVLGPLSQTLGSAIGNLAPGDRDLFQSLAAETRPSLSLFYGEEDRIIFVSKGEGGLLSSGLSSLSGFSGLLGVQQSLARAVESESQGY